MSVANYFFQGGHYVQFGDHCHVLAVKQVRLHVGSQPVVRFFMTCIVRQEAPEKES